MQPLIFAIIGGIFAYGLSLLFGIENMYLNAGFIAVVMGVVLLVLNVWFNREFVDTVLELIGKRRKNNIGNKSFGGVQHLTDSIYFMVKYIQ